MPQASVIIPAYNAQSFIRDAILSALNQTVKDIEVIVVDDGSTDDTRAIVCGIEDSRVRYYRQENRGNASARNCGIAQSKSPFIAFLDADDICLPHRVEKQLELFKAHPELGLVYADLLAFTDEKFSSLSYTSFSYLPPHRGQVFRQLLRDNFIPTSSVMMKKEILSSLQSCFDESLQIAEDYDLWLRIAYRFEVDFRDEVLGKYRRHPMQLTVTHGGSPCSELSCILRKWQGAIPDFDKTYPEEKKYYEAKMEYERARTLWRNGDAREARRILRSLFSQRRQAGLIFICAFFMRYDAYLSLYHWLWNLKFTVARFVRKPCSAGIRTVKTGRYAGRPGGGGGE